MGGAAILLVYVGKWMCCKLQTFFKIKFSNLIIIDLIFFRTPERDRRRHSRSYSRSYSPSPRHKSSSSRYS